MLFGTSTILFALVGLAGQALAAPANLTARAEKHNVKLVNNCGSGKPVFIYRDNVKPGGSRTINGPLYGGVAWMDGYKGCGMSGVNCGTVEFSLLSPGTDARNTHSAVNYSLLGKGLGNHNYKYPMNWKYTGSCSHGPPGPCRGPSKTQCPGAYVGTDTFSGKPVTCHQTNVGLTITFC